jgi:predicted anti-sigma-YlaC factor YlaD
MKHGTSEQEWIDSLDGVASSKTQARIEAHLTACVECRRFLDNLLAVDALMEEKTLHIRQRIIITRERITAARNKIITSLENDCVSTKLEVLRWMLAPMCGTTTANRAIGAAAQRVAASSPKALTEKLWPCFVEHLRSILAPLCGEPAAHLIWECGVKSSRSLA